jgi:hypothetical protein
MTTNGIIRINLKVYESLDRNNSVITQYTAKYYDRINNTIIRAYRSYHILTCNYNYNTEIKKKEYSIDPSDYEASIDTVLNDS